MKCEECGEEVEGNVCTNCGLVIESKPIAVSGNGYPRRKFDVTTLYASEMCWSWDHPLSPKIRKSCKGFNPRYQKKYDDYIYVKAYESISKICATLRLPNIVKTEALNLFKGIRDIDEDFFKRMKLAPTYLACVKIACKINDYPILNYDLAETIDYKLDKDSKNISYMEKKFNRAYREIIKLYKLKISTPKHPRFIDYACGLLKLPYTFTIEIHNKYTALKNIFEPHFRPEGYILALIYIYGRQKYNITLKLLEETFHTSSLTISNRKNELLKVIKNKT